MKQDSTKNHLALAKTNRVSKYTLSVQELCYSWHKYKDLSKKFSNFSYVLQKWMNKFETYQKLKMKKIIKQVSSK